MKKKFIRIIDDHKISVDLEQDFIDDTGNRHPRNVLWLWSDDDLWDVLHIRVVWENEPSDILTVDPITIPAQPEPPLPVGPPPQPLPPDPAPPAPEPEKQQSPIDPRLSHMVPVLRDAGIDVDDKTIETLKVLSHSDADISLLMAYGGIAVRTLRIAVKGGYHQGHRHNYDHLTNVVKGSVLCEVDGARPKVYTAPCQITIAAEHWHKFTAMEDDVIYQCVYRQPDREDLYTDANSPYDLAPFTHEELIERLKTVDNPCAHCDCDKADVPSKD